MRKPMTPVQQVRNIDTNSYFNAFYSVEHQQSQRSIEVVKADGKLERCTILKIV